MSDLVTLIGTRLTEIAAALRRCTQVDLLGSWLYRYGELEDWQAVSLSEKGYVIAEKSRRVLWLRQRLVLPETIEGFPTASRRLRLALTWWAEDVKIYVNDRLVGAGDLFDARCRVLLQESVMPGEVLDLAIRLVSPGHDDGALMRSLLVYESGEDRLPEPSFLADELEVISIYLCQPKAKVNEGNIKLTSIWEKLANFSLLTNSMSGLSWDRYTEVYGILHDLGEEIYHLFNLQQNSPIYLLGHAHLDLAWLWETSQTWDVAEKTFSSVLKLQSEMPELTFCHTSPVLYEWLEINRPQLFDRIVSRVRTGRWEVVGGMWVEPDLNCISGESIVRQILYGQIYCREKLGELTKVCWLPDTFGFTWQLPQLLKLGEIDYFVTQKLRWNDTNQFPHSLFWWESPDGSRVLSYMSSPIGEGIDPVQLATYDRDWHISLNSNVSSPKISQDRQEEYLANEGSNINYPSLWLFGVGDRGGGPTRDMLEVAKRWQNNKFLPTGKLTTAKEYLDEAIATFTENNLPDGRLPNWRDELYLEFHRGCYTTHAKQKANNRYCEDLLYRAELWSSLALVIDKIDDDREYISRESEIEAAWKEVLFNQFHDILPGTAITPVYTEANERWEKAIVASNRILEMGLRQITTNIATPEFFQSLGEKKIQYIIFNSLNHSRETIVIFPWEKLTDDRQSLTDANGDNSFFEFNFSARYLYNSAEEKNNIPSGYTYRVCDDLGRKIKTQNTRLGLAVFVSEIPSIGYRSIFVDREENKSPKPTHSQISTLADSQKEFILENEKVRIEISSKEGTILSYYHKHLQKELLKSPSNQLLTFVDSGQYWDAWNIDPNYREHPLPAPKIESIQWYDRGELYNTIRVIQTIENSTWIQDYTLFHNSSELIISTSVKNWQTRHRLVKARFDFNLNTTFATYEIPCGAIERLTQPQTAADRAKWEVPGLRWADLTDTSQTWGISLINDSKYGYSTPTPSTLELTLLRAPKWPDPEADRGDSHFTYTLYPHLGSWQTANIVAAASNLNSPLTITTPSPTTTPQLPPSQSLLAIDADNFIPTAFKPNRHHPGSFTLRGYESTGKSANISITNPLGLKLAASLNLLESPNNNPPTHTVTPWQIATWQVNIED